MPESLARNDKHMKTIYNVPLPIEPLYNQVEDAIKYVASGGTPYSPEQVLAIAYNMIAQTKALSRACKEWRRQNIIYKTRLQFQINFSLAHKVMCNNQLESDELVYGGANAAAIQGAEKALENLAAVIFSDYTAVTTLITTNTRILQELDTIRVQITTITADSIVLHLKVTCLEGAAGNAGGNRVYGHGGRENDAG